jgi:hypothetical protein
MAGKLNVAGEVYRAIAGMDQREINRFRLILRANLPGFIAQAAELARGSEPVRNVEFVRFNSGETQEESEDGLSEI